MEPSVSRRRHTSKNEIIPSSDSSSEVNWMVDSMVLRWYKNSSTRSFWSIAHVSSTYRFHARGGW